MRAALLQVRDRALLAAGQCTVAFPAECADALPELFRLLMSHLDDNIYSVREDAAVALGDVVRAYRRDALDRLLPWLRCGFAVRKWLASSSRASGYT